MLVHQDGQARSFDLGGDALALSVPGALCWEGDRIHVGMWNGILWSLSPHTDVPQRQLEHDAGIQALGISGDQWLVSGLDGNLAVYTAGRAGVSYAVEPLLLGLRTWPGCAIAVGERQVHRVSLSSGKVLHQRSPVGAIAAACLDGQLAMVVNAAGHGVRLDSELNVRGGFHTSRGARPLGVDREGKSAVFAYPDGSHVLMVDDRVVFSSSAGPLAVSPDGRRVALNDGPAIKVLELAELTGSASSDRHRPRNGGRGAT
jgi:hypothetical protein